MRFKLFPAKYEQSYGSENTLKMQAHIEVYRHLCRRCFSCLSRKHDIRRASLILTENVKSNALHLKPRGVLLKEHSSPKALISAVLAGKNNIIRRKVMKKRLTKLISLTLCFVMLISAFSILSSAMSVNQGISALRTQWTRGAGPSRSGYSIDYSCYSPKKGDSDTVKYPLCVFLAGAGQGSYEGKELYANNFPLWSSDEYQSRFQNAGGSYLLIARAPEPIYWDTAPTSSLKAAIDDYVAKNPNIDPDRIYVIGWCLGAVGATRLATDYPDSFAGLILHANRHAITASEAASLKNTAVWLINSTSDSYSVYGTYCVPSWKNLRAKTSDTNKLRLTTCSSAPTGGALFNHVVWNYTAYDCSIPAGCENLRTVNGRGETIENVTAISWISQWSKKAPATPDKPDSGDEKLCSCQCHSSGFTKFIWNIKCLFYKFFGMNSKRTCSCGAKHW